MHFRKDFELTSIDGKRSFGVFIRRNKLFTENFSIGLLYFLPEGGSVQLIRMNGNHGQVVKNVIAPDPHYDFHVHRITVDQMDRGLSDPEYGEKTDTYASFEQAMQYFLNVVQIKDAESHFPPHDQMNLFEQ